MEFWGVEVKAGQPLKVKPTFDNIIHLSQASLGETKKEKGRDSVPVFVTFGDKKLVLGTLIPENIPQLSFDLVFEKEFELSHNWKNGSVYFCGYQTPLPQDDSEDFDMDDSEEEEELTPIPAANGKAGPKVENAKATAKAIPAKPVAAAKPKKDIKPKEEKEDDDSDDSMDDGFEDDDSVEVSDEEAGSDDDEDDSDEEEDSDDDEETPKKVEVGKKRPGVSAIKTPPVSAKKAKAGTPQTDGKKGGVHVATPYPSKQGGKAPASGDKTPKSSGQQQCKTCSKTFGSDSALQSHTKAKHSAAK